MRFTNNKDLFKLEQSRLVTRAVITSQDFISYKENTLVIVLPILLVYDIASKFMILRKGKSAVNGCGDGSNFDFVLVNMANISAIDELADTPLDVQVELEPPANIDLKK